MMYTHKRNKFKYKQTNNMITLNVLECDIFFFFFLALHSKSILFMSKINEQVVYWSVHRMIMSKHATPKQQ